MAQHEEDEAEYVARLLAATEREEPAGPVPDEVAERLDATLATESTRRTGSTTPHRWPRLLVAAATLSVVGLGITQLDDVTGSGGDASSGETAITSRDAGGQAQEAEPAPPDSAGSARVEDLPAVEHATLRRDVRAVLAAGALRAGEAGPAPAGDPCRRPRTAPTDRWGLVRLDGEPAVLVLRGGSGLRRTVEIFACDRPGDPVVRVHVRPPGS